MLPGTGVGGDRDPARSGNADDGEQREIADPELAAQAGCGFGCDIDSGGAGPFLEHGSGLRISRGGEELAWCPM